MLSETDIQALVAARHPDPFSVLGLQADAQGRWWVRALLPQARRVAVLEGPNGRELAVLEQRHADGLYEGALPQRKGRFDYRLRIEWDDGRSGDYADAYAYGPLLPAAELQRFAAGEHLRPYELLGAHPLVLGEGEQAVSGVRFAVWAPTAQRVSVVGDFNTWDGRRHPMRRREAGVWELFLPHAAVGDRYKFEIISRDGRLLPLKADPYARAAELRPATASIVAPLPPKRPLPAERAGANADDAPISVYELHAGSWRRHPDGRMYSWPELAEVLPAYVADLGFTHLELLPIMEHPFDGSWGYQTLGMYAPSARFGPAEGFARFVQACHAKGLGVLLDWVPAHFPLDAHGPARFDGSALYEYADPREGFHRNWNTAIYNFARQEVRDFLAGSALYWLERFGVDGLRVDAVTTMLYRDHDRPSEEWVPNIEGGRENLEAIGLIQQINRTVRSECPGAITCAEESSTFPGVTRAIEQGGLGFHFKWNMGWMNDTLEYVKEDHGRRKWHHEKLTFGLVYAFDEQFMLPLSHDEVVHGKGSILGRMPGDDWRRFANLRAYYGFMWGHPGKKLLFMGQEFGQPGEWNHDVELPWGLLADERHAGVQRLVRDLNWLYRTEPALHKLDGRKAGFEWIESGDAEQSVLAWLRHDGAGRSMLVACNFTPTPRTGYRLGVPAGTRWREVLNTDASVYGGSNVGQPGATLQAQPVPAHGQEASITLTLPPLATVFLLPG
ncbi:MAG: 1,4-alpha-glucan branching protein GlgB [Pseudomonadota bacterium]